MQAECAYSIFHAIIKEMNKNQKYLEYIATVKEIDQKIQKILKSNPHFDYMDLFHIYNNLNLPLEERLRKGLQRWNLKRFFRPFEKKLFEELNKFEIRYLVVGMTAAILQGSHALTEDIDIWVENLGNKKFVEAVNAAGGFYIPPAIAGINPPMLGPPSEGSFDLVTNIARTIKALMRNIKILLP